MAGRDKQGEFTYRTCKVCVFLAELAFSPISRAVPNQLPLTVFTHTSRSGTAQAATTKPCTLTVHIELSVCVSLFVTGDACLLISLSLFQNHFNFVCALAVQLWVRLRAFVDDTINETE